MFRRGRDNRTKLVGESLSAAGGVKLDYSYDGLELDTVHYPHTRDRKFMLAIDEQVSTEAARYIQANGPDLSWVYLEFTDDMGHMYGDSPEFYDAVTKADVQIGKIWKAIQARKQQHGEDWMIVVTTDHGRDVQTGKHHGGQSDRERTTWIATNAQPLNAHFTGTPATVDIAPSILSFMNIKAPQAVEHELDGVSFVNNVSISNLKAITRFGNAPSIYHGLPWITPARRRCLVATTNEFATGGVDNYRTIGKVPVAKSAYTLTLPSSASGDLYKIVVKSSGKYGYAR